MISKLIYIQYKISPPKFSVYQTVTQSSRILIIKANEMHYFLNLF